MTVLLLVFCLYPAYARKNAKFEPDQSIVYKTVDQTELRLHVFKPEEHKSSDSRPAIVFFFGGG